MVEGVLSFGERGALLCLIGVSACFYWRISMRFNSILSAEEEELIHLRLLMVEVIGQVIESGMGLLGIEMPERM